MPAIASTPRAEWSLLAAAWHREHPREDPLRLDLAARESCPKARAAYWWSALGPEGPRPSGVACTVCGTPTAAWCEGCYHRCRGGEPFQAVCNPCDNVRQKVCHLCQEQGITYAQGHEAYQASRGPASSETAIEITGFSSESGELFQEAEVPITFEELSRITGLSADDIRRALDPGSVRGTRP